MKTMLTGSELKKRNVIPEMKNDKSMTGVTNVNGYSLPVIRVDYRGRILYANKASFPLLREWNCLANDYLPDELVLQNPALLDFDASFDLEIQTKTSQYHLDVIGFRECGYIGLYGYNTENIKSEEVTGGLKTAFV